MAVFASAPLRSRSARTASTRDIGCPDRGIDNHDAGQQWPVHRRTFGQIGRVAQHRTRLARWRRAVVDWTPERIEHASEHPVADLDRRQSPEWHDAVAGRDVLVRAQQDDPGAFGREFDRHAERARIELHEFPFADRFEPHRAGHPVTDLDHGAAQAKRVVEVKRFVGK